MLLVGLVAAVAILMIFSAVAVQNWSDVLRRDREADMMAHAQEIVRAIRKYQRDKPGVPLTELKLLMEPGSKRQFFLRKLYKDPLVKDGKWGLLYAAPQGGVYDTSVAPVPGADPGGLPGTPGTSLGGLAAGMSTPQQSAPTGIAGSALGGLGQRQGEATGLPIVGVKSLCKDQPFRVYKDNEDYAKWLFTVFDLDQQNAQQPPGAPPVGSGAPPQPGEKPGEKNPTQPGGLNPER
jgi:type II secretory pathway pseudopilin PulG